MKRVIFLATALALVITMDAHAAPIKFSDNGAWSWFQDERAVVDPAAGRLIVGSTANRLGTGGLSKDGDVDVTFVDIATRRPTRSFTLRDHLVTTSTQSGDDHNTSALLVRPDGAYLAMYAGHNNDYYSRYRIYKNGLWSPERVFDWSTETPGGSDFPVTYSNLFYLSAERRVYNIARSADRSPNFMVSNDLGETWRYGGQLTEAKTRVGYVDGYFKYTDNGVDRIDFIATEHHPRDFNTSIYHGFIKGGKSHATDGRVVDGSIFDRRAPSVDQFTRVFRAGTVVRGQPMTHTWTTDVQTYRDGTITALFKARAGDSLEDQRIFYARNDGHGWKWQYIAKAGPSLCPSEQDYTGLGALDPTDPKRVYISTPIDPRDGESTGVHEIYSGKLKAGRWHWRVITQGSSVDNLRPIMPESNARNRVLLWMRGTYNCASSYDVDIVGRFLRSTGEQAGQHQQRRSTASDALFPPASLSSRIWSEKSSGISASRYR